MRIKLLIDRQMVRDYEDRNKMDIEMMCLQYFFSNSNYTPQSLLEEFKTDDNELNNRYQLEVSLSRGEIIAAVYRDVIEFDDGTRDIVYSTELLVNDYHKFG